MMLDTFVRDKNLEAMLTKAHRENKRFSNRDRHTFVCISTMMNELEDLIVLSNTTHQGKSHLKQWLDSFSDHRFSVDVTNLDAKKYQKKLVGYINALRNELNCVEVYRDRRDPYFYLLNLSEKLQEITWSRGEIRSFLTERNRRYIDRVGYLKVPVMRGADYIFLFNVANLGDFNFVKRTVVLISGNPVVSPEKLAAVSSINYVEAVVVVGGDDCSSRIYLTNNLNDIYGLRLKELFLDSESLFTEVSEIDGELRNCISDVLSRIEHVDREFEDYASGFSLDDSQYKLQVKILKKVISEASRGLSAVDRKIVLSRKSKKCLSDLKMYLNVVSKACGAKLLRDLGYEDIDKSIHKFVNAISKNRMLYGEKTKGDIHSEDVIASILKALLETKFDGVFSVTQEEKNGSGFSDIAIKKHMEDITLIECKMLRNSNERMKNKKMVSKGINQVYDRYSKRIHCSASFEPLLYLILFAVDPNWKNIHKDVEDTIKIYCERNSLEFTLHGVVNKSCIEVRIRETQGVSERDLVIQVLIVELEDRVNEDDYALKPYDPKA